MTLKKSTIKCHIALQKHHCSKEKVALKIARGKSIVEPLNAYDSRVHPVGESLPSYIRVRCVKVVQALLKAGISPGQGRLLKEATRGRLPSTD